MSPTHFTPGWLAAGAKRVGDTHLYPHPGRRGRSAWRPPQGCCTRKAVGDATGTTTRGTGPWCARRSIWRPAGARTRQGETIHPAPDPRHPGTPPPSSPTTRRTTELALRAGRTRACWAGARAEAGGRHPQGTRGPTRWPTTTRSKTIRDTAPSGRARNKPGTHNQKQLHSALGHRTQGEVDQEHRATRQAARDTAFRAVRDTPSSPNRRLSPREPSRPSIEAPVNVPDLSSQPHPAAAT